MSNIKFASRVEFFKITTGQVRGTIRNYTTDIQSPNRILLWLHRSPFYVTATIRFFDVQTQTLNSIPEETWREFGFETSQLGEKYFLQFYPQTKPQATTTIIRFSEISGYWVNFWRIKLRSFNQTLKKLNPFEYHIFISQDYINQGVKESLEKLSQIPRVRILNSLKPQKLRNWECLSWDLGALTVADTVILSQKDQELMGFANALGTPIILLKKDDKPTNWMTQLMQTYTFQIPLEEKDLWEHIQFNLKISPL